MADLKQEYAINATVQTITIDFDSTIINDGTVDIFKRKRDPTITPAGNAATLIATPFFCERLKATDNIYFADTETLQVVCATGESSTLRVISGKLEQTGDVVLDAIAAAMGSLETVILDFDDHTAFASVNDGESIVNTENHITGTSATMWNKAGTHVNSGVKDTFTAIDLSAYGPADSVMILVNVTSVADIASFRLQIGTDSSNYSQWDWDDSELVTGWQILTKKLSEITSVTGTGIQPAAVTYCSLYFIFDAAGDALQDITADHLSFVTAEAVANLSEGASLESVAKGGKANSVTPTTIFKTVTTNIDEGVSVNSEPLVASSTPYVTATVTARTGSAGANNVSVANTGNVHILTTNDDLRTAREPILPGQGIHLPDNCDLADFDVAVDVDGEGVLITYTV